MQKTKPLSSPLKNWNSVVGRLESSELDLDKCLELFEKGVILYKDCKKKLEKVEKKIAKLSENLKEGPLSE